MSEIERREVLPQEVADRLVEVLAERGEKVLACLRTADAFLRQATEDESLRYAESASYNVREALDAVVEVIEPVRDGVPSALDAWHRYVTSLDSSAEARDAAWRLLEVEMDRLGRRRDTASSRASKLIGFLRQRTGVDALASGKDPVAEYSKLRDNASKVVHTDAALGYAADLFDRAVTWFVRLFTPPESIVQAIRTLAEEPYRSPEQLDRLEHIALDQHHLRLFLRTVTDPAWLPEMLERGLIKVPEGDDPWPVAALIAGLGQSHQAEVAAVLDRLLRSVQNLPQNLRVPTAFELLRTALHLGPHGHDVAVSIVEKYRNNHNIIGLGVEIARSADAKSDAVERVVDAALGSDQYDHNYYRNTVLLTKLASGITADNAERRIRLLSAKLSRLIKSSGLTTSLDAARLTADLDERPHLVDNMAHHLAQMLHHAQQLGVTTNTLLEWTKIVPGDAGGRLASTILATADDVPTKSKIEHIRSRLTAPVPTGDDRDLIAAILATSPPSDVLAVWADELGSPSQPVGDDDSRPPEDWIRVWRWSTLLPTETITSWTDAIAEVTRHAGEPQVARLEVRTPRSWSVKEESPFSVDDLATLPPLEAARVITAWRPDSATAWHLTSARALARTLEQVIASDPLPWAADAVTIVDTLREPIYVLHYFRAIEGNAEAVSVHAPTLLRAAARVRSERWDPVPLGNDNYDYEPGWSNVDIAIVDLAANLARVDSELADSLDELWAWATAPIELQASGQPEHPNDEVTDALYHAINSARGLGLRAAISLARWELRNAGTIRPAFETLLNAVLAVPGAAGSEYRAILAQRRPLLETLVPEWFEAHAPSLFSASSLGLSAFSMTLKYSQPTLAFFNRFQSKLTTAARRGIPHADAWLALALVDGTYTFDAVIAPLRGDLDAVRALGNQIAFHGQHAAAGSNELASAIKLWRRLIAADRRIVPGPALQSAGRWAFVTTMPDSLWAELTLTSLQITAGQLDLAIEVADRCAETEVTDTTLDLFRLLLETDAPWERAHVAGRARHTLAATPNAAGTPSARALDRRLTELGFPPN